MRIAVADSWKRTSTIFTAFERYADEELTEGNWLRLAAAPSSTTESIRMNAIAQRKLGCLKPNNIKACSNL